MPELYVDANLVVKWYTWEEDREQALALVDEAERLGITIVAPDTVLSEAGSTIRKLVYRKLMTAETGWMVLSLLKNAPIQRFDVRDLFTGAWHIAEQYNLGSLYDAYYMALAQARDCDFWTADRRFLNSVSRLPYVRDIRDFTPGMLES
jgi:predicted nucleic acid-binding protein